MTYLPRPLALHLILMDMSLPVVDGLTATRAIQEMDRCCAVPIVAVTAHSEIEHREKAFAAGCVEFVSKPIDFQRLEAVIQKCLLRKDERGTMNDES